MNGFGFRKRNFLPEEDAVLSKRFRDKVREVANMFRSYGVTEEGQVDG